MASKVEICGVDTAKLPLYKEAEMTEMLKKIKEGDASVREKFITGNLRLVLSVIQRFTSRGENPDDLFQVGCIGLIKALDNFDMSHGVKFSTYAVPMITGEIRRFLRDDGMIKVSRSLKENVYKSMKARDKFCQQYQREPTIDQISQITMIRRVEFVTSLEASNEVESIHQSAYQKDGSEISLLDKLSKGENESEKVVDHVLLKEAMKHLEQKEQQMIYYRYFEGKTQQEIAKIFHISQVQVSRIQKKILKKLRRQMIGNI